jgi:hypothetical protein
MMIPGRSFTSVLVAIAALTWNTPQATAQGLDEAKAQLPTFTSTAEGQKADLYVYYPSVNVMVKVETSAAPDLFTDAEFGYAVGDFGSVVSEVLAQTWYQGHDQSAIASAAQQLEAEAKTMRQPFQQPGVTLAVAMDDAGVAFTYSGKAADGVTEVSFSTKVTWDQAMAQQ